MHMHIRSKDGETRTKRAQVLMPPSEYKQLVAIARQKRVSVGELIRAAVQEKYFADRAAMRKAAQEICNMNIPLGDLADPEVLRRELEAAHDIDLP
jgi:hypothetical protein